MTLLEDTARAYVSRWYENRDADPTHWTVARVRLDAAWHDLVVAAGFVCEMCEKGSCPGVMVR